MAITARHTILLAVLATQGCFFPRRRRRCSPQFPEVNGGLPTLRPVTSRLSLVCCPAGRACGLNAAPHCCDVRLLRGLRCGRAFQTGRDRAIAGSAALGQNAEECRECIALETGEPLGQPRQAQWKQFPPSVNTGNFRALQIRRYAMGRNRRWWRSGWRRRQDERRRGGAAQEVLLKASFGSGLRLAIATGSLCSGSDLGGCSSERILPRLLLRSRHLAR